MAGKKDTTRPRCSFCGRTENQVMRLLSGPAGIYICDQCVDICNSILDEEMEAERKSRKHEINLMKPEEIKAFLDDYVIGQDDAKKVLAGRPFAPGDEWVFSLRASEGAPLPNRSRIARRSALRSSVPRFMWSMTRPGVPTTT